jgi:DNA-binding HxlR family transcriptional regulator
MPLCRRIPRPTFDARAIDAIGDWWSLLIVRDAFDGPAPVRRLPEESRHRARHAEGAARELVETGALEQIPASDGSAYQEYVLTRRATACSRSWSP